MSYAHADQEGPSIRQRLDESGILIVDKPKGLTSMDVIRVIRRVVGVRRIGHGGTLDPFARGVLPILINQATKLSAQIMDGVKEYEGTLIFGQAFDTQDMTGTPLHPPKPVPSTLNLQALSESLSSFTGEIWQLPPLYSAVKRKGRPLYDYARAGESVEIEPRKVFVEKFVIDEELSPGRFHFLVRCAKGTYVRTLVHDLGQKWGCGAVIEDLVRTQTGPFHIDQAVQLSTLRYISDIKTHLKSLRGF